MKKQIGFKDVLIVPTFSHIKSRKDVDTTSDFLGLNLRLPIISSNMDTITNSKMAHAMKENGAISCLHRFMNIEENIDEFLKSPEETIVSFGLGLKELNRAEFLHNAGARNFCLDVAHGASTTVVEQVKAFRTLLGNNAKLIVGNFATAEQIDLFNYYLGDEYPVDAYKIGIGSGSVCSTRVKTGCGLPTLSSLQDCARTGKVLIADGGCKTAGDIVKALAAGASAVMIGGMFSGTDETPGDVYIGHGLEQASKIGKYYVGIERKPVTNLYKRYRGSASKESYDVQGKIQTYITPEGEAVWVKYKGPVKDILQDIEGGLRSAYTYVGAANSAEFKENVELVEVSTSGMEENYPHANKD